jgi:hypothetical protein
MHAARDALCAAGALCWRNNVGVFRRLYDDTKVRCGLGLGSADLVGCYRGRLFGVELKTPIGRQSPEQRAWQRAVEQAGGLYVLARTVDEAVRGVTR